MRTKKISADISKEASDMLTSYCEKHERSKGFLLEKMIRKFCGGEEVKTEVAVVKKTKATTKRFIPPTVEQVREYCDSRCNNVDAESFVDHYATNGWVQGKNKPVKCWKACVRTWEKSDSGKQSNIVNESLEGKW